jgi:hypothetical protein
MYTKRVTRIAISVGLLVVILLAVQVIASNSAPASDTEDTAAVHPANYYTNSDYFERHPPAVHPANYYTNSDYFERHPPAVHPANYYTNSDYFERHQPVVHPANYYTNSDYFERHPEGQLP